MYMLKQNVYYDIKEDYNYNNYYYYDYNFDINYSADWIQIPAVYLHHNLEGLLKTLHIVLNTKSNDNFNGSVCKVNIMILFILSELINAVFKFI